MPRKGYKNIIVKEEIYLKAKEGAKKDNLSISDWVERAIINKIGESSDEG